MRIKHLLLVFTIAILALGTSACLQDECDATRTFIEFEPVYMTAAQIRQNIEVEAPRTLKNPGKIYVYGDYILVNELHEGIHIINNKDPRNPLNISFIRIPGNLDIAVRNNMLYADNLTDLITINIQNPATPVVVRRSEDVFPLTKGPNDTYLTHFRQLEVQQDVPCDWQSGWFWRGGRVMVDVAAVNSFSNANGGRVSGAAVSNSGTGGSMARFTISGDYLYTVDNSSLLVFDISQGDNPQRRNQVSIGWGIETIFPYGDNLFIGSRTGMFIFDNRNPLNPVMLSVFQHAMACDPVFVEGNIAYVTLRDGTDCQNFNNQLDIVDISNLVQPRLLKTHRMHRPHGLSVWNKTVYLCDDDQGLKVFDAQDWNKLKLLSHLKHFAAYDVITLPQERQAIVVGRNGLYQFDISDPAKLRELSRIPVNR